MSSLKSSPPKSPKDEPSDQQEEILHSIKEEVGIKEEEAGSASQTDSSSSSPKAELTDDQKEKEVERKEEEVASASQPESADGEQEDGSNPPIQHFGPISRSMVCSGGNGQNVSLTTSLAGSTLVVNDKVYNFERKPNEPEHQPGNICFINNKLRVNVAGKTLEFEGQNSNFVARTTRSSRGNVRFNPLGSRPSRFSAFGNSFPFGNSSPFGNSFPFGNSNFSQNLAGVSINLGNMFGSNFPFGSDWLTSGHDDSDQSSTDWSDDEDQEE